ncbi:MAG: alpha/beta hydrolase [Candidatus Fermentibacteria bacterium]
MRTGGEDPREHSSTVISSIDNVDIAYEMCGSGETAIVFIHGWCSDRWFWHEQLQHLSDDYILVAIDLAGHGESGRNREAWSLNSFADDVLAVVDALNLDRFVTVGHSMGGLVALKVARCIPERVIGLIGIDSIGNVDSEKETGSMDRVIEAFSADFVGTMTAFLPRMFAPHSSPDLIQSVVDRSVAADPMMALAIMQEAQTIEERNLLSSVDIPVRCIYASMEDIDKEQELINNNADYADFDAVYIENVGHFLHLENPTKVNRQIRKFMLSFL